MGIRAFFNQEAEDAPADDGWAELAQELGLSYRLAQGNTALLEGELGGYRTLVVRRRGEVGIKVKFRSGLDKLSIRSRSKNLNTNRVDIATGDDSFDLNYRLLLHKNRDPAPALDYLTPRRRRAIESLGDAFLLDEIDEDELEVKIEATPSVLELREALALCIEVARHLDGNYAPQDEEPRPTPQDQVVDR